MLSVLLSCVGVETTEGSLIDLGSGVRGDAFGNLLEVLAKSMSGEIAPRCRKRWLCEQTMTGVFANPED